MIFKDANKFEGIRITAVAGGVKLPSRSAPVDR
jgi:hypothetical protein